MTSQDKWNFIVSEYQQLYSKKEEVVDNRWRQYCNTLFGYQPLFNEICTQPSIRVGAHDHAIPDIVLCIDGKEVFDIELKRYSFPFCEKFEEQLISYLKLQTLTVGMIVCKDIYLYSYDILSKDIKKIRIEMTENNPMGISLVELLQKESFSTEAIRKYIESEFANEVLRLEREKHEGINIHSKVIVEKKSVKRDNSLDLVYENVSTMIELWCRNMTRQGRLVFHPNERAIANKRFTTDRMDNVFPMINNDVSGFGNQHLYMYEIRNDKKKHSFRMKLALGSKNASPLMRERFEMLFKCFDSYPPDDEWEWRNPYGSESFKYDYDTIEQEVFDALDLQYRQIMLYEDKFIEYFNKVCGEQ